MTFARTLLICAALAAGAAAAVSYAPELVVRRRRADGAGVMDRQLKQTALPYCRLSSEHTGHITLPCATNARERMLMAALVSALAAWPHATQRNVA